MLLKKPIQFIFSSLRFSSNAACPSLSALFVSNRYTDFSSVVKVAIDIGSYLDGEHVEKTKELVRLRDLRLDVDQLRQSYANYTKHRDQLTRLEMERRQVAYEFRDSHIEDKTRKASLIAKGKEIREKTKQVRSKFFFIEEELMHGVLLLPNKLHPSVPKEQEVEVNVFQQKPRFTRFTPRNWIEIGKLRQEVVISNVGPKACYLVGRLAMMDRALCTLFNHEFRQAGFVQLSPPALYKPIVVEAVGTNFRDPSQVYIVKHDQGIPSDDQHPHADILQMFNLCGSASLPALVSFFAKTSANLCDLPMRAFATGPNYDPQAFQTNCTEALIVSSPFVAQHDPAALFDLTVGWLWSLYQRLGFHMRLINVPAPHLRRPESLRYQLQMWSPASKEYINVARISMLDDYISRRLVTRVHGEDLSDEQFAHFVHVQALTVSKLIQIVMETNQDANGDYTVPEMILDFFPGGKEKQGHFKPTFV